MVSAQQVQFLQAQQIRSMGPRGPTHGVGPQVSAVGSHPQIRGTQENTMSSPQIQQAQVRIPSPSGVSAATATAGIATGHRLGAVQVRNPKELMAQPQVIPTIGDWYNNQLRKYTQDEQAFMLEQVNTWKGPLADANQDDFSFNELFEELSNDDSYSQYRGDPKYMELLRMGLNKVYYDKWQIMPDYDTYRDQ